MAPITQRSMKTKCSNFSLYVFSTKMTPTNLVLQVPSTKTTLTNLVHYEDDAHRLNSVGVLYEHTLGSLGVLYEDDAYQFSPIYVLVIFD